ncbi:hypothetical protein BH23GEM7_BH23GEM7_24960 [soil metagenome]
MSALLPAFSGRWDELYLFSQCRDDARRGQPQLILIEGEPGIGKTALLGAFAAAYSQHERRPRTYTVRPPEAGRYDPIHEAVAAMTGKRFYEKVGGRSEAKDLAFEWIGALPGPGDLLAAIGATADALRRRQLRKTTQGIVIDEDIEALLVAARRPLVLFLDDLHLMDEAALPRFEALIRAAGRRTRLLLVGVFRPAPRGSHDPPIRRLIQALPAESIHLRKLRALTPKEMALWLDKQFPRAVKPASFLDWIYESSGGHPATIAATLTQLLERSVIRFVGGHWEIQADPEHHAIAEAESTVDLGGIDDVIAEVVRGGSVLGDEFDGASLARLLERDELYIEDQLALAVHQRLLQVLGEIDLPDGDISTLYRFTTPYLRASLYRSLPGEQRAELEQRRSATSAI